VALSEAERALVDAVGAGREELVALLADLIAFDTTARAAPDEPPREEAALQDYPTGRSSLRRPAAARRALPRGR
jgi:hypothetical protein